MNPKTIVTTIFLLIVAGGGAWLYLYSNDPLHTSCKRLNADPHGLGLQAADAVYDSLSDAAKSRTTRIATRMHVVTVCQVADEDMAMSNIRDKIERDLSAEAR